MYSGFDRLILLLWVIASWFLCELFDFCTGGATLGKESELAAIEFHLLTRSLSACCLDPRVAISAVLVVVDDPEDELLRSLFRICLISKLMEESCNCQDCHRLRSKDCFLISYRVW